MWHHENKEVAQLLNEFQELANQCNSRKNNLQNDWLTRQKAESAEMTYLYCLHRLKDSL